MSNELVGLLARRFIQRRDVKAVQFSSGAYVPDYKLKSIGSHAPLGFKGRHLASHLAGEATYGHYLLDSDSKCRLFAFDIDLEKSKYDEAGNLVGEHVGAWCKLPPWEGIDPNISDEDYEKLVAAHACDPREIWRDRRALDARAWLKYQMRTLADKFCSVISRDLGLPTAATYSGNKGIHVYGFTGEMPASEARAAALLVLDILGEFDPIRGQNFYKHKVENPLLGFQNFSVEVFPKQDSLDGKDLGNLLRLPLGRNLKTKDPTFFIDMTTPAAQLAPHADPIKLLETGDPWQ